MHSYKRREEIPMDFIKNIIEKHIDKVRMTNEECNNLISQMDVALNELQDLVADNQFFVEPSKGLEWRSRNASLMTNATAQKTQKLKKAVNFKGLYF